MSAVLNRPAARKAAAPMHAAAPADSAFPLGKVIVMPLGAAALAASGQEAAHYVERHARCDWSEMSSGDRKQNSRHLAEGERIVSAYTLANGARLFVVTEAERVQTLVKLYEDGEPQQ